MSRQIRKGNDQTFVRAHIRLNSQADVIELVQKLSKLDDDFVIENNKGTHRINAKSVIGVMYTMLDFPEETYLVNETNDGALPACIDIYRV